MNMGSAACYTSANFESITSEAFFDSVIDMGAYFIWYFHYMPVGNDASPELMPDPVQRRETYRRIRKYRMEKPLFAMDFQNDAEYVGGCIVRCGAFKKAKTLQRRDKGWIVI